VEKSGNPLGDPLLLLRGQLREHGHGDNLGSNSLGNGEVAGFVAEGGVGRLQVQRDRVVDAGSDAGGVEVADEAVDASEQPAVLGGTLAALGVPAVEVAQFDAQNRSLDGIQPAVVALDLVVVLAALAVVAQQSEFAG
jgi:hypothetical protein